MLTILAYYMLTSWLESKGIPLKQGAVIKRYIILNGFYSH